MSASDPKEHLYSKFFFGGCTNSDTNTNPDTKSYANAHPNWDAYPDAHTCCPM